MDLGDGKLAGQSAVRGGVLVLIEQSEVNHALGAALKVLSQL